MMNSAELVFQNELLVQRILQFSPTLLQFFTASDHRMLHAGLQLRLVNSKFNTAVLFLIRQEYRTLKVTPSNYGRVKNQEGRMKVVKTQNIQVNDAVFSTAYCEKFFEFLQVVAKVKVEHLEVKNLHKIQFGSCSNARFCDANQYKMHKYIVELLEARSDKIKTFVGMTNYCHESCTFCGSLISQCRVYGYWHAKYFDMLPSTSIKHFDTLVLNEQHSCDEKWIPKQIRCDKLVVNFSEGTYLYVDEPVNPFPLETFRKALTVWKPKELTLAFVMTTQEGIGNSRIAKMRLDEPLADDQKAIIPHQLEVLRLDLRESVKLSFDLLKTRDGFDGLYHQVIANARRLMPCKKMIVELSEFSSHFTSNGVYRVHLPGLLRIVLKFYGGSERSLELNLRLFPWIFCEQFDIEERVSLRDNWFTVSFLEERIECPAREATLKILEAGMIVGRTMRLSCAETDCVINLEMMFEKRDLEYYAKCKRPESMGIMKHFVPFLL